MTFSWRYGLELAGALAAVLVVGNLGGDDTLDTYPWMISTVAFPIVLYRLLVDLQRETRDPDFLYALREAEAAVRIGAVAFGLFEFAYAWVFYDAGFELWPVFFGLPVTVFVTWTIGMVTTVGVAWYLLRPERIELPDWLAEVLAYSRPPDAEEERSPFDV